ncbi:hypothetical protein [Geobacter benzoatilyticus]|jgi:F0F1-type ATP synthase assembly protein I|uniref:Uncharacterized protein n=1 Tax=Geobacter benzoatilyticus TaxID=2815309 RepID=A0ABX7Q4W6_9BACT|nr:hypothetical protein [Geobacter benzoatilyticus]QSV45946.1 hypothetical protein JZM60_01220 [Geobacter benzoatilyticus]
MSNDDKEKIDSQEKNSSMISSRRVGGFILGFIFGCLLMLAYFMGASPSEYYSTSKGTLLLILIGCGIFGAIIGEKAMETVAAWLSWFG